jgi:hypothetical protein
MAEMPKGWTVIDCTTKTMHELTEDDLRWIFDNMIEAWSWMAESGFMDRKVFDKRCAESMAWLLFILESYTGRTHTYRIEAI